MDRLVKYLNSILNNLHITNIESITNEQARSVIKDLNNFLYVNYDGIGKTIELGQEMEYLSDYHKFWKENCEKILNPTINIEKCEKVADIFHDLYMKNKNTFYSLYSKEGLKDDEVCKIRFYSATQDFRGSRSFKDFAEIYKDSPSTFDKDYISENPAEFVKELNILGLAQDDKRIGFAQKSAEYLKNLKCEPYDLIKNYDNDLLSLRESLIGNNGMGFGNKKADMFIRDMVVLGIWKEYKNFDKINVASDINTIKVALRTGILSTEIPLVSSFLDIFCYQYCLIDDWTANSWNRVWNIWKEKYPKECIEGPCLIDYLVYRIIGKEFCKENLAIYQCEEFEHTFKWHSSRNRKCQICARKHHYVDASLIQKKLPCTDPEGSIYIEQNQFVRGDDAVLKGIKECPLKPVCNPESEEFVKYNGPKSISILGQTGWTTAYAKVDEGGGGLMS